MNRQNTVKYLLFPSENLEVKCVLLERERERKKKERERIYKSKYKTTYNIVLFHPFIKTLLFGFLDSRSGFLLFKNQINYDKVCARTKKISFDKSKPNQHSNKSKKTMEFNEIKIY